MIARFRLLPTVLLVSSLTAGPLLAQNPGAGPPPGGQAGGGMGRPGGGQRPMQDPTVIDGPIMPEEFAALAALDSAQERRYATIYQNLMTSTRSDREGLKEAREKRRQMASGGQVDREAMRADREKLQPAYANLQKQQESFDKALKEFLKPEQLKAYNDWKESKREEQRAQFGGQGRRP